MRGGQHRDFVVGLAAALVGIVSWLVGVATAPSDTYGPNPGVFGSAIFAAAFVLAVAAPRSENLIVVCLVLPSLALAPFTLPRDDGALWLLILPLLALNGYFLLLATGLGRGLRALIDRRRAKQSARQTSPR